MAKSFLQVVGEKSPFHALTGMMSESPVYKNHRKKLESGGMPLYEIAFGVAVILFSALGFMQHVMRQQVHHARFGSQEISPRDVRYSNPLFGRYGIWTLHKHAYERSGLRSSFVGVSLALLLSLTVGLCNLLYRRCGL